MTLVMDENEISYKTLRKIQQAEKNSPQITKINNEFYYNVTSFLHELENRLEEEKKPQKQMLLAEECQNIEKIIRNIYEQREKKIILAAIAKARGGNPSIKTLIPEEKTFFSDLYHTIVEFRKNILTQKQDHKDITQKRTQDTTTSISQQSETKETDEKTNEQHSKKQNGETDTHPILRIVDDISFVGTDNNTYNLYKADIVSLPPDMAQMLLTKKAAIQVKEQ